MKLDEIRQDLFAESDFGASFRHGECRKFSISQPRYVQKTWELHLQGGHKSVYKLTEV